MPQQPELQPLAPTPRRKSSLHIRGQDSRRTVSERRQIVLRRGLVILTYHARAS